MNGVHDMGGEDGHGPVEGIHDDEQFHAAWERQVLALTLAAGATGSWNLDQSRHAREQLPPAYYLTAGYYRIWLAALEHLLVTHGLVTAEELSGGAAVEPPRPDTPRLPADKVRSALRSGSSVERDIGQQPLFTVGEAVIVRNLQPRGHTRLPGYIRGRRGRIARIHAAHVYPDSHAAGEGEQPRWLYNVCFEAAELWGDRCEKIHRSVMVDCWEPYLRPDPQSVSTHAERT